MQFEIILAALSMLYVYERFLIIPETTKSLLQKIGMDHKPLNCIFCVSWWVSIIILIFVRDPEILTIPILYRITQLKLLR